MPPATSRWGLSRSASRYVGAQAGIPPCPLSEGHGFQAIHPGGLEGRSAKFHIPLLAPLPAFLKMDDRIVMRRCGWVDRSRRHCFDEGRRGRTWAGSTRRSRTTTKPSPPYVAALLKIGARSLLKPRSPPHLILTPHGERPVSREEEPRLQVHETLHKDPTFLLVMPANVLPLQGAVKDDVARAIARATQRQQGGGCVGPYS